MIRSLPTLASLAVLSILAACGGSTSSSSSDVAVAKSGLSRETAPNVAEAERTELAAGNTAFAADLYASIAKDPASAGQNLFFSPYSVSIALAMTYASARRDTAAQMAKALHFTLPQERLHPAFDWLDLQLTSRGKDAKGSDGQPFRLHVANSLWAEQTEKFEGPFLDTLAVSYGAGVQLEDFLHAPDAARKSINGWVSDKTESKIQDLLAPGTIDSSTRFVLVNAIYFNAAWATKFDKSATANGTFHRLDGSSSAVSLMKESAELPYAEGDGWQAVALPYDGRQLSMLVIVPTDFASFESKLSADTFATAAKSLQIALVNLSMPKFEQKPDAVSLKKLLTGLGMTDAFDPTKADFSAIAKNDAISISDVLHKAFIRVDEDGTEAAAATAVIGVATSAPQKIVTLTIDRPFVFAIRDDATGTILFLGRELSP